MESEESLRGAPLGQISWQVPDVSLISVLTTVPDIPDVLPVLNTDKVDLIPAKDEDEARSSIRACWSDPTVLPPNKGSHAYYLMFAKSSDGTRTRIGSLGVHSLKFLEFGGECTTALRDDDLISDAVRTFLKWYTELPRTTMEVRVQSDTVKWSEGKSGNVAEEHLCSWILPADEACGFGHMALAPFGFHPVHGVQSDDPAMKGRSHIYSQGSLAEIKRALVERPGYVSDQSELVSTSAAEGV